MNRFQLFGVAMLMLAVSWAPNTALASGEDLQVRGDDLVIRLDYRWAGGAAGGYYPLRIRVNNRGETRTFTFRFTPQYETKLPSVNRTLTIDQNATVEFTLSVPLVGFGTYGIFSVHQGSRELEGLRQSISLPDAEAEQFAPPGIVLIAPNDVTGEPLRDAILALRSVGSSGYSPYGRSYSSTSAAHQHVGDQLLPKSWVDYTGLDLVMTPLSTLRSMDAEARNAILEWVRSGGNLLVYAIEKPPYESEELAAALQIGAQQNKETDWTTADVKTRRSAPIARLDEFGNAIMKSDGSVETLDPNAKGAYVWEGDSKVFFRRDMGWGQVIAFSANPFPGSLFDWQWLLQQIGTENLRWTQRHGIASRLPNGEFLNFLIPGVRGVPRYAFLTLITLFAVIIGPVNYIVLLRRKRLQLLVITIPVIAMLTSGSLLAYSAVAHGFGTKSRVRSVTLLDQNSRSAISMARISLYAGLAPSKGLRFSPNTAVLPIWPEGESFDSGSVDWTETQALTSGWLKARTRTQFLTLTSRPERGRIDVKPVGDKLELTNGLEWDFESFIVTDDQGKLFSGKDLAAGSATTIESANAADYAAFVELLAREPLEPPPGVDGRDSFGLFESGRDHRYRYGSQNVNANFNYSRMEQEIMRLKMLKISGSKPPPRYFAAILKQNPKIELGLEGTDDASSYHLLVGNY